jgi:UTP pyrophosphatase
VIKPANASAAALIDRYLRGYSVPLITQARELTLSGTLPNWLRHRYPEAHTLRTDAALYRYVMDLKATHLRSSPPLSKASYDPGIQVLQNALGTHTTVSRVQGGQLKAKREIRIASLFKTVPLPFLSMICVHELAHIKEREHNKAFYQLCQHMEPDYARLELEVRLYLCWRESPEGAEPVWPLTGAGNFAQENIKP